MLLITVLALARCGGRSTAPRNGMPTSGAAGMGIEPSMMADAAGNADAGNGASAGAAGAEAAGAAGSLDDDPGGFAGWSRALALVWCERKARCQLSPLVDACVESLDSRQAYIGFYGGVDFYADLLTSYRLADESILDACLSGIAALKCDESGADIAACSQVWVALSPRQEGESCARTNPYLTQRPCDTGLLCDLVGGCWACVPPPLGPAPGKLGETCDAYNPCAVHLHCEWDQTSQASTCREDPEPAQLGESCYEASGCQGVASCQVDSEQCPQSGCTLHCVPMVGEGGACGPGSGSTCFGEFRCVRDPGKIGVCRAPLVAGARCFRSDPWACVQWCVFPTPDSATGTCGVPPNKKGPTPCASTYCPAGTYREVGPEDDPEGDRPSYCNCLPLLPKGALCTSTAQCAGDWAGSQANRCVGARLESRRCGSALTDGATCIESADCASWRCNEDTKKCDPIAICVTD